MRDQQVSNMRIIIVFFNCSTPPESFTIQPIACLAMLRRGVPSNPSTLRSHLNAMLSNRFLPINRLGFNFNTCVRQLLRGIIRIKNIIFHNYCSIEQNHWFAKASPLYICVENCTRCVVLLFTAVIASVGIALPLHLNKTNEWQSDSIVISGK